MPEVTLSGVFEPIRAEVEADGLEVEGTLPVGLEGTFYRIGPNPQFQPIAPYNPLQGDGMVHAFRIEGGRVGYRNRWVRTQQWAAELARFTADTAGAITRAETIPGPFTALIHDFAVTENFVVIPWAPVTISMERIRAGGPPIAWEPKAGFWLGVMPRGGTAAEVRWFEGEPGMAWHVAGAFDAGGRIVVDVCEQAEAVFPRADGRANDPAAATQRLTRWTLDWDGPRRVEKQRLHAGRCEYPRIDDRRMGRPYRYAWVARAGGPGSSELVHRGLGRFDHETGAMQTWDAGPTVAVGEPVFAPAA